MYHIKVWLNGEWRIPSFPKSSSSREDLEDDIEGLLVIYDKVAIYCNDVIDEVFQ